MTFDDTELKTFLESALTPLERGQAIVYRLAHPVRAGTTLNFPGASLTAPWDALVLFVDREPTANWGHPARYLLVNPATRELRSVEARLPPFGQGGLHPWSVTRL